MFRRPTTLARALLIGGLAAAVPASAAYAPIPEQEQGKDLVFRVRAGVSHDSNIFGAANNAIDSFVFTAAPTVTYNASLTPQTFFAGGYTLTLDHFTDRPGDQTLDSHDAFVRLAHAFSPRTTIDLNNAFTISRNPESLLAGVPVNSNQSFDRNQFDGRFSTGITPKLGLTVKGRSVYLDYHDRFLGQSLDRTENLYGLSGDYAVLPEIKAVAEYRHQDVNYRTAGQMKDKTSEFLMGGVDYEFAKKLSFSGRLGAEWRKREAAGDTTAPYAEFSAKYDYTQRSFVTGGYVYTLEETSDVARFTDAKVHRLFVNVQHAVSALIVASGSFTYEPSTLQGRRPQADISEKTVRGGVAVSYLPTKNWALSTSFDHDRVRSDDRSRNLRRNRFALSATFTY